jgi:hypothetical protein
MTNSATEAGGKGLNSITSDALLIESAMNSLLRSWRNSVMLLVVVATLNWYLLASRYSVLSVDHEYTEAPAFAYLLLLTPSDYCCSSALTGAAATAAAAASSTACT